MTDLLADLLRAREVLDRRPVQPTTWTVPPGTCIAVDGGLPCLRRRPCPDHDRDGRR